MNFPKTTPFKSILQVNRRPRLKITAAVITSMAVASLYLAPAFSQPNMHHHAVREAKLVGAWGKTSGSQTNVRIRPASGSPSVAKVPHATAVMVWGTYQGWYRVETPGHRFGWVYHAYLNVPGAAKLKELSHAKAKLACNSTDDTQILYGSPQELRLYYAKYKSKGALLGLKKLGLSLSGSTRVAAAPAAHLAPAVVESNAPSGVTPQNILQALHRQQDEQSSSVDASKTAAELPAIPDVNTNYTVQTLNGTRTADAGASEPNRGGSPRDIIGWANDNGRLAFGKSVANHALSFRGMPYIYGAQSPSHGFDCSGLVSYVLHKKGLHPPRTAAEQSHYGKPVSRGSLKPGDLVFFANTDHPGVSHVGIYIGNNNFVHAANPRKGVRVDSLYSAYYSKHYYGARRPPQRK